MFCLVVTRHNLTEPTNVFNILELLEGKNVFTILELLDGTNVFNILGIPILKENVVP